MLSSISDREAVRMAVQFYDVAQDDSGPSGLQESLDRLLVDVQTLECLEDQPVCRRCPVSQTKNAAGSVSKEGASNGR